MTASTAPPTSSDGVPSVLVLLAVHDAADWVRDCLRGLASQTHPRVGVLAIDDGSTDDTHGILVEALGEDRVVRHPSARGMAAAFASAAGHPAAAAADHILLLHGDAVLDPDAIARLVEATQLAGVDRVGIVGGKVVAHDAPRRLLDVGRSADRFGHPYSPLQPGEIDQGQFDRVLEVLGVDTCAALVSRETWQRVGLLDERLEGHGDVDLGWRARVAGFRVLMTPLARVRRRVTTAADDPTGEGLSRRHGEDRAALATILKNDAFLTLLWVVPLFLVLSVVRLVYLALARRFEEASELIAAVGWNVAHLPGTLRRRRRIQRVRAVKDRALRRFTESAGLRLPRWFASAERILEEQRELEAEDAGQPATRRLRHRTASLFTTHPVLVVSAVALVIGAAAVRHLIGPDSLAGGALPRFPDSAGGFWSELVSAYRTTGLGGTQAATPGLGAMGGLSFLLLGSTVLAQKAMLLIGPALATVLCYRACARWVGASAPAALAAGAYGLSAVVLWAFSDGRLAALVALAVLPPLLERTATAFRPEPPPEGRPRFVAGLAVTLAIGVAFVPGLLWAFALVTVVGVVAGPRRGPGLAAAGIALLGAAVLLFPFVPSIAAGGAAALGSFVGEPDPWRILRLALGPAPGDWLVAAFLPAAALVGLGLAAAGRRADAVRVAAIVVAGLALAWAGAAGYLPTWLTNPTAFVGLAAAGCAVLVAVGLASIAGGVAREPFGARQVGAALMTFVLTVGLGAQALSAMAGDWAVGGTERITPAWAVVDSTTTGRFRVLWVGGPSGRSFPPPGGDPVAEVAAGGQIVRYQLTDRAGALAVDTGRSLVGDGADALDRAVAEILRGGTDHGGALLAPFAVRFVVADPTALPGPVAATFGAQVDLDRVPSSGLTIWRNGVTLDSAEVVTPTPTQRAILTGDGGPDVQRLTSLDGAPLAPVDGGWEGPTEGHSDVWLSTTFDAAWGIDGSDVAPVRAAGWATSFPTEAPTVRVRYGAQLPATVSAWLLAAVWAVALWLTRKQVRS
ncbi:MAG TPA: glycosyltransferase family 2 protein [Actinomycetota bacterium]|nr:glycosyltransferase family 2 protein [Actinomycetota bacterium]